MRSSNPNQINNNTASSLSSPSTVQKNYRLNHTTKNMLINTNYEQPQQQQQEENISQNYLILNRLNQQKQQQQQQKLLLKQQQQQSNNEEQSFNSSNQLQSKYSNNSTSLNNNSNFIINCTTQFPKSEVLTQINSTNNLFLNNNNVNTKTNHKLKPSYIESVYEMDQKLLQKVLVLLNY